MAETPNSSTQQWIDKVNASRQKKATVNSTAPTTNPTTPGNTAPDWLGTPGATTKTAPTVPATNAPSPTETAPSWMGAPANKTPKTTPTAPVTTDPATPPTPKAGETTTPPASTATYEDNMKARALELQSEGKTQQQVSNILNAEKKMGKFGTPTTQEPAANPNKNTIKSIAQRNAKELGMSSDSMVDALMRGNDLEWGTPEYEVAKGRVKDIQVLSTMPAAQIANSVLTNQILPGSQRLLDLQKYYPELAQQVQDEYVKQSQLGMINEFGAGLYDSMPKSDAVDTKGYESLATMKAEGQKSDTPDYFDALAGTVREQFSQSMGEDAQEMLGFVEAQLNDPKIIAQKEKVIGLNDKKTELELLIKNTEEQVRSQVSSEAPEAFIAAYIQEMTGDLYDKLDSVNRSLFTEQSMLTAYTDTANQNIQVYQAAKKMDMEQKQAEAKAAAEERKMQYTMMMDQAKLEMDYARMAMDQEQNMFDRQKFYTQMGFDEQKFQRDQQKYMQDQQWDAYKFQTEMDQKELDQWYDILLSDDESLEAIQMKDDAYRYLFMGIPPGSTPQFNVGEEPVVDISSGYVKNIGYGKITSFGGTHDNYQGIDIDGEIGDPLPSIGGTVVRVDSWNGIKGKDGGYGNSVEIKDANGYIHKYSHLDQINVKPGDVVGKGKVFGTIGNTGYVIAGPGNNGSHLDYSIRKPSGGFMKSKEALEYIKSLEAIKGGFEITPAKQNLSPVINKGILAGIESPTQVNPNLSPVKNPADIFSSGPRTRKFVFPEPSLPETPFTARLRTMQTGANSAADEYGKKASILSFAKKLYETGALEPKDITAAGITMEEFNREGPKLYIANKAEEAKKNNFKVVNQDLLFGNSPKDFDTIGESMQTANELLVAMNEYKQLVDKVGTESRGRWNANKGKLEGLHTYITLGLKEKAAGYNLGVLNGKDRDILVSNFPEMARNWYDIRPATQSDKAKIDMAIKNMTSRIQSKAGRLGFAYEPGLTDQTKDNPLGLNLPGTTSGNKDTLSIF